jgi:hypothetical protein
MRWLEQQQMRIGMLFDRGNRAARLNDEMREHLGRQIDENLAAGMNAEDARSPALVGLVLGLAGSAAAARLIQSMLYETYPVVFTPVTTTLLAVAMLACAVPAWRPSRLDPKQALRTE